jgi:NADPH-ferrihemoprotein reductase
MQLQEELESRSFDAELLPLNQEPAADAVLKEETLNIILVSVSGVGEPPDNARPFYEWLMTTKQPISSGVRYSVFGLGNSVAHPKNYNVIGKKIDAKLEELGASRLLPLGLGDDGDCLEDDFDKWMEAVVQVIESGGKQDESGDAASQLQLAETAPVSTATSEEPAAVVAREARRDSLVLAEPQEFPQPNENLLHIEGFYQDDAALMTVEVNRPLAPNGGEQGLHELVISLPPHAHYETGDQVILYPHNANCFVDAFLRLYENQVNAERIIMDGGPHYPHPTGVTLRETLTHCIDLGAIPSPALSRFLLQRKQLDYKGEIVNPHLTVLDLLLSPNVALPALQDLLPLMPIMQPRYYSIASSPKVHPRCIYLTYRPIKYVTPRGNLREGVCTSYMSTLARSSPVVAAVRSNPTFRLPSNPQTPVIMIAGGCGIAPIRALLEDRLFDSSSQDFGPALLFLGFRSPGDEVYREMVTKALNSGAVTEAYVSYSGKCSSQSQRCQLISDTVGDYGQQVMDLIQNQAAHVYLCGGAHTFGAAIQTKFLSLLEESMTHEEANAYLQRMVIDGRLSEDLAD